MKIKTLLLAAFFLLFYSYSFSQLTLDGKIKNEKDEPLSGATVLLENKAGKFKKTTQSAGDGSFHFTDLPFAEGYTLNFTYVGYVSRVVEKIDVAPGKPLNFDISLEPAASINDEVVVVAYSTQKKANLTGAVDQVSGKVLENRSLPNLTQGLQGFIPNLNLVMGDGKPTQSPVYNIRGNTSIGQGGNALVLIDGVEGDPSLLNPNDVANVTVLKDAASAAIYGAREPSELF